MRRSAPPWPEPGRVPDAGPARHRRSAVRPAPAESVHRSPRSGPGRSLLRSSPSFVLSMCRLGLAGRTLIDMEVVGQAVALRTAAAHDVTIAVEHERHNGDRGQMAGG